MSNQDVDVDILDLDMEGASMSEGEDGETVDVDQEVDTELKGIEDIRLQVIEALKKKEERKKQKDKKKKLRKLRAEKAALERQLRELMESSGDESEEEVLSPTTVNTAKNRKKVSFAGVEGVSDISQTFYEDQSVAAQRVSGVRGAPMSEGIGIPCPTALSSFWDQGESGIVHSHDSAPIGVISGEAGLVKPKKSGITSKAWDKVEEPQLRPHVALLGEGVNGHQPSFSELDFRLFIAGELEIVTSVKTSEAEKIGRLHLLKQLAYLCGGTVLSRWKGFMHILFLK